MKKDERVNLVLTPEERFRLEELAEANTGENISLMIRRLINLAWTKPSALELHAPKEDAVTVN